MRLGTINRNLGSMVSYQRLVVCQHLRRAGVDEVKRYSSVFDALRSQISTLRELLFLRFRSQSRGWLLAC